MPVLCAGCRTSESRRPGQSDLGTPEATKHHPRFEVYMASVADWFHARRME